MTLYRFDQIVENINVRVMPSDTELARYVGLEHLDPESLKIRRWGSPTDVIGQKLRFWEGDIIYGRRRAYQRKVAVADFEGICSAHAMVLRAKPDVCLPEFLPFFLQSELFHQRALEISVGSLSPTINWTTLARQEFPLPPLDEQRRIAALLWAADDAAEQHKVVLTSSKMFARSLWKKIQDEKNHTLLPLKEVAKVSNGSTPSRAEKSYWENGTIPWLPTQKVNDRIITGADEFITELALEKCHLKIYPRGSVLVAMIGEGKTRGTAAYLEIDSCINQNFACIVPTDRIDSHYLFYCLDNSYERLRSGAQGGVHALNCRLVGEFEIPVPNVEEQRQLSEKFQQIEQQSQSIQKHIEILANLKKSLLQSLLR